VNAPNEEYGKEFQRELPVALTDIELQMQGKILADKVREKEFLVEKRKQLNSEFATKIKAVDLQIKRIADARSKGQELRPVQCRERFHSGTIEVVRLDTKEVVDSRPAELRDLQTSLPGTGVPEIPEDFDAGSSDDIGTGSKSNENENEQTDVTSSSGDTVSVGAQGADAEAVFCPGCGDVIDLDVADDNDPDNSIVAHDGSHWHAGCAAEAKDGEVKFEDDQPSAPVEGADPVYEYEPAIIETEDERLDRMVREREGDTSYQPPAGHVQRDRDIAQREKEIAAEKSNGAKKRERSKAKNDAKKPAAKPTKKR